MKKLFVSVIALMAGMTLYAQDLATVYNEGASAYGAKNYVEAIAKFEQVISEGEDDELAEDVVAKSKTALPICYQQLGAQAAGQKKYDEAIEKLTRGAELAEQFGDSKRVTTINGVLSKVYQVQGGTAFNNKDYAAAAEIFAKGYAANPRNTEMALNLAMSYCESGNYIKGMEVYESVAAMNPDKYADAIAEAQKNMAIYTTNEVAKLQKAKDFDGIIAMADELLAKNPTSAVAEKVRIQAYLNKQDYAKVIELGETAAAAQTNEDDKSTVYYTLASAYNAKEMKPQAIAAFRKVTSGPAADIAQQALALLTK